MSMDTATWPVEAWSSLFDLLDFLPPVCPCGAAAWAYVDGLGLAWLRALLSASSKWPGVKIRAYRARIRLANAIARESSNTSAPAEPDIPSGTNSAAAGSMIQEPPVTPPMLYLISATSPMPVAENANGQERCLSSALLAPLSEPAREDPTRPPLRGELHVNYSALEEAKEHWPRRLGKVNTPCSIRLDILNCGIKDIKRTIYPRTKAKAITGQMLAKYIDVLNFMKVQALQERNWLIRPEFILFKTRKELAKQVTDGEGAGTWTIRQIMRNEVLWIKERVIESCKKGRHIKITCMMEDESTMLAVCEYISLVREGITSHGIAQAITTYWAEANDAMMPPSRGRIVRDLQRQLSRRTGCRWLAKLGFKWKEVRKGVYNDGHERDDVKDYRDKIFLPYLKSLEASLMKWDESLNPLPSTEVLSGDLEAIIMVTQDECTFNSNDGRHFIWVHEDHQPLRKKGRGQGLHVSDFLTHIGRLEDGSACEILKCKGDIWWDGETLLDQVINKAIPAFEAQFPGCKALFLFDNAKNYCKYADDALRVSKMNLADGGKNAKPMRTTYVVDGSQPAGGYYQSMIYDDRTPKGLRTVLQERGLWPINGTRFLTQCSTKTPTGNWTLNPKCLRGGTCCARALLALQPDFKAQKGEIEEAIERAGHLVLFYPAFHCEINFIEYFWEAAKQYTRQNCGYDFPSLQRLVPEALAQYW
ncbi:hypothetical protein HOY80DRAFT_1062201 [Tuber brumale]|nr:hypothetical protein HOY80DRAFT_1062201 [Tuber brumale]